MRYALGARQLPVPVAVQPDRVRAGRFRAEPDQELSLTESVKERTLSLDAAVTDESREAMMKISRRVLLVGGLTLISSLISRSGAGAAKPTITVYKSPT